VRNGDAGLEARGVGPQGCEAAAGPLGKRTVGRIERLAESTPFRPCRALGSLDKIGETVRHSPRRSGEKLRATTRNVWLSESIRQKIIGHRMAVCGRGVGGGLIRRGMGLRGKHGALALLDQPAGDHGVGIFIEPLVEQGRNLLAEIGRVTEAGEFVALQGVAGSGEKELPGRLGAIGVHGALRLNWVTYNVRYRNSKHSMITSNLRVTELWKSVGSEEISARACSGCAGDYEDPDRSAWAEDFGEDDGELLEEAGDEPGPDE
jgi:hypothetical protein